MTICTVSWVLFYVTLVSRFVALKLVISVIRLYLNKNIEEFYENIALSPYILLAFIPSTLLYYYCLIPFYVELQEIIIGKFQVIKNNLVKLALTLMKILMPYLEIRFTNIIKPYFDVCFRPIHCDSPKKIAKLFKELPFAAVDSKVMAEECRTSNNYKSREELIGDFKAFRAKISLYTPSSMQSDHSNQSTIQHSESSKGLLDKGNKRALDTIQEVSSNKRQKAVLDIGSSDNNSVENSIDIVTRNNYSITSDDFANGFFDYSSVHGKISNLIKNNKVKHDDLISKLVFEPKTLKKTFYRNVEYLVNTPSSKAYFVRLNSLLKILEDAMRVDTQNRITSDDFANDFFDYSTIHGKITNLINNNKINRTDNFSKLVFEPKTLRIPFYRKVEALGLSNYKKTTYTTFNSFLKTLENNMDIPAMNINSITKKDFSENTFDSLSIYLKLNNLVEQGQLSKKKNLSQLIFEPESLRQPFYRKIEALKLTNVKATSSMSLSTLLGGLKVKADMIIYNDLFIEREDFLGEKFKFDVVHRKITNLINEGEANKNDYIYRLKFQDAKIRQDFYTKIQDLKIIKNKRVLRVKIGTLLNNLKQFTS